MIRFFRLAVVQLRISATAAMAYRSDFLLQGVMELIWISLVLLPLLILYGERESVAGWDEPSALILVAYFVAIRGVLEAVVSPSLVDLVERIRSGAFDYVLLKPVDAQVLISVSRFDLWKVFDLLGALALVIYAFGLRGAGPSLADVALGVLMLATGVIAMYALWLACAAAAFWVVRLDNLMYLLGSIFDVARWPVHVFRGAWRVVFTFVIPVAVMTTYPAMALLGRLDPATASFSILGSLALLVICRIVWRGAIRNYTSASS